ncbi:hypothetical protein BsWGS_20087 [Bradybaena similaris]
MLFYAIVGVCVKVSLALFPRGPEAGDTEITSERSALVSLSPAFPFYGLSLASLVIYRDGFFCFDNTSRDLYLLEKGSAVDFPAIAVWASAVRTSHNGGTGSVSYRLTRNVTLLRQISESARSFSELAETFYPLYAAVVTWQAVGTVHYDDVSRRKTNTFQALLATDGNQSLAWVEYSTIQWIYDGPAVFYDDGGSIDTVDFTRAQVGFYKGDKTTNFLLPMSFTPNIRDIATDSNVNRPGVYVFRLDTVPQNVTVYNATTSTTQPGPPTVYTYTMKTTTLLTEMSTDHLTTDPTQEATDDTTSAPIVGMSSVCAVLTLVSVVSLILVLRIHFKNRHKRFHSRKVGPEEPITLAKDNRQSPSPPAPGTQRLELYSASSVVSTAGIRVLEY